MYNPSKRNRTQARYYVDFYDMIDGWGIFGFYTDCLFDNLENAIKCCRKLQSKLNNSKKDFGEHYGVIDGEIRREVFCGKTFEGMKLDKKKLKELVINIKKRTIKRKVRRNTLYKKE